MKESKIKLSLKDRIILANQYRILETLYPDEAGDYERMRTIVEEGFEYHYDMLNQGIAEGEVLNEEEGQEVFDVLEMHRALKFSYQQLKESDKKGINPEQLEFDGFDGNNETKKWIYVRFLVHKEHRWEEVLEGRPNFDLNSHSPTEELYARMLRKWKSFDGKFPLSASEIKQVLAERVHPEYRK